MTLFDVVRSHPEIIQHIQESVHKALKVYARSEIIPKAHFVKSLPAESEVTVIGKLELQENGHTSMLSIGFSQEVFFHIYENLFEQKLHEVSSETADLAGELINIIFQSIDPELRKLGYRFDASLPNVLVGTDHCERVRITVDQSLVLPFSTERGDMFFEVFETKG